MHFRIWVLTSSEPLETSLSEIFEKVLCHSACCCVYVIVKDHFEFEESNDKENQEYIID